MLHISTVYFDNVCMKPVRPRTYATIKRDERAVIFWPVREAGLVADDLPSARFSRN